MIKNGLLANKVIVRQNILIYLPAIIFFSVKASCNGETWSEPLKMEIQVLQPLLLRWYFILLYILISIFIVYMIIRNFKIREKRKNELFLAQKEKQQIRELSEMKMNFFMNLSHEFRTPLTLIISPLQKITFYAGYLEG